MVGSVYVSVKIYKVRRKIKLEAREGRKEKGNIENKEVMERKVGSLGNEHRKKE